MIHVITRTNKRPNKFKLCAESVQMQTAECEHVTISEDQFPSYCHGYIGSSKKVVNAVLKKSDFAHYNEYLDWGMNSRGEQGDYFAFLDDDDFYLYDDSLQYALEQGQGADLIIWRVNSAVGIVPSRDAFDNKQIQECNIDMNGFLIKKGSFKNAKFGDKTLGDFRFLNTAQHEVNSIAWVDAVLSSTTPLDKFGGGKEQDLPYSKVMQGHDIALRHFKHFRKWN